MKGTKIVVTGGAGFIGTNLLCALKNRYPNGNIISIDIRDPAYPINNISYIKGNVTSKNKLFKLLTGAQKIFHLAAIIGTHESFTNPKSVFNVNVGGTLNLLDYIKAHTETELYVAAMPGIWNNPYSISKDAAVRLAQSYFDGFGIKFSSLRWYSVYGQYQYLSRYNKAVPTFINNALNNVAIPVYGDGNQTADFLYVEDAVNCAIDALEKKVWGKVIPCSCGKGVSVNDLAMLIIRLCNSNSKIIHLPMRLGEPAGAKIVADVTMFNKYYNRKLLSLEDGLKKTIAFYKKNKVVD